MIPRVALPALLLLCAARSTVAQEPNPLEAEVARLEAADQKAPPARGAVLFLGSSSIRLWDLAKSFPGRATINRGFGGSTFPDAIEFLPRLVTPHAPRVVVVYSGDNDLAAGRTPEQIVADWRTLASGIERAVPGVELVVLGIKPCPSRWALIEKVRLANQGIEASTRGHKNQRFLRIEADMLGKDGKPRPELFREDGLHLSPAGYEVWTRLLTPVLDELAAKEQEPFQPLLGKTLAEAEAWLKAHTVRAPADGKTRVRAVRPIRIDGEPQLVSEDHRKDRVNVAVEAGKISAIDGVY